MNTTTVPILNDEMIQSESSPLPQRNHSESHSKSQSKSEQLQNLSSQLTQQQLTQVLTTSILAAEEIQRKQQREELEKRLDKQSYNCCIVCCGSTVCLKELWQFPDLPIRKNPPPKINMCWHFLKYFGIYNCAVLHPNIKLYKIWLNMYIGFIIPIQMIILKYTTTILDNNDYMITVMFFTALHLLIAYQNMISIINVMYNHINEDVCYIKYYENSSMIVQCGVFMCVFLHSLFTYESEITNPANTILLIILITVLYAIVEFTKFHPNRYSEYHIVLARREKQEYLNRVCENSDPSGIMISIKAK